jgi:lipoyl(octanoyl) transferase
MEEALIGVCGVYAVSAGRVASLTGVWIGGARKIGAIGIHVSRGITSHGFAFNVRTDLRDFQLINPCGITDKPVTSLEREAPAVRLTAPSALPGLDVIAREAAHQFGIVFRQEMVELPSVDALRQSAAESQPQSAQEFPAEDAPVQVPAEVDRLMGNIDRPVRA